MSARQRFVALPSKTGSEDLWLPLVRTAHFPPTSIKLDLFISGIGPAPCQIAFTHL